jgi:hypothetical protein
MTDKQKALLAVNELGKYTAEGAYIPHGKRRSLEAIIRAALEAKAVDVEGLKREVHEACPKGFYATKCEVIDHLAANGYLPKPDHTDHIADDILSIVKYTGNDLEGFNRFIGAARMCGYDLVRKGKPLAPDHTGLLREAFMECFEELIGIYDFYHPSGRGEGDLSNAKRILSKHNNFYEKQAALGEK